MRWHSLTWPSCWTEVSPCCSLHSFPSPCVSDLLLCVISPFSFPCLPVPQSELLCVISPFAFSHLFVHLSELLLCVISPLFFISLCLCQSYFVWFPLCFFPSLCASVRVVTLCDFPITFPHLPVPWSELLLCVICHFHFSSSFCTSIRVVTLCDFPPEHFLIFLYSYQALALFWWFSPWFSPFTLHLSGCPHIFLFHTFSICFLFSVHSLSPTRLPNHFLVCFLEPFPCCLWYISGSSFSLHSSGPPVQTLPGDTAALFLLRVTCHHNMVHSPLLVNSLY